MDALPGEATEGVEDEVPGISPNYELGDSLDWSSNLVEVTLSVELPFWLMVDDCNLRLPTSPPIDVAIRDTYSQLHIGHVAGSGVSLVWQGPNDGPHELPAPIVEAIERDGVAERLCRSVVLLKARAHEDIMRAVAAAAGEDGSDTRENEARIYLASLCEAHLPFLNNLIQRYRLATYDYIPHEVAAWDVPVWIITGPSGATTVQLLEYATWDHKPVIRDPDKTGDPEAGSAPFRFTSVDGVERSDPSAATPGELELLDARSLMERGDYTGAVRRCVTAIEAVVEHALRRELSINYSSTEVEEKLLASRTDYPGRYRQWKKLSGTSVSTAVESAFDATRRTRHEIVHNGLRLTHAARGEAQMDVDTARWLFNAIENDPARRELRERPNALREVGRAALAPRFETSLDPEGVLVLRPDRT